MSTNDISPKIIANMQTRYTGLLKAGATNLGADEMSKSIFAQIDNDGNGNLTQNEIDVAMPSLSNILKNAAAKAKDFAKTMFGESANEQAVDKNIENACNRIIQYAKEHPEDERIQKYAAKIPELLKNGNITSTDSLPPTANGLYKDGQILLNNNNSRLHNDEIYALHVILHELGHAESGDGLDSISEERDVESYAREITAKLTGPHDEIPSNTIDEWLQFYENSNYPKSSPGYDGIPKNVGVTIDYEIESVKRNGNNYIIKSEPNANGRYIETVIVMSKNTDNEGNLIPESATETLYNSGGNVLHSKDMGVYNPVGKYFYKPPQPLGAEDPMTPIKVEDDMDTIPEIELN